MYFIRELLKIVRVKNNIIYIEDVEAATSKTKTTLSKKK